MKKAAIVVSLVAIGLVIAPAPLLFAGMLGLDTVKQSALFGTIGWFVATPFWMSRDLPVDAGEVEI